jgi:hypothetical protein
MQGLNQDGTPLHEFEDEGNPVTTYMVTGDPVAGTGWLDPAPADKRMLLSMGPFRMAPGETQVLTAAIMVGQGADRLSSITALRSTAAVARDVCRSGFRFFEIVSPVTRSVDEGQPLAFVVSVLDPPGGTATLSATELPPGATFQDNGDGTGSFSWNPGSADSPPPRADRA